MGKRIDGATAVIKSLEAEGVEVMFGYPGGAILPVYDPMVDTSIRHILVRHEQGAGHMAEGYAQATGKPGVCVVTSGPGATNIVTPLADAYLDSIPLVAITGQVALGNIGTDAFQECDTTGITRSITKHNYLVTKAGDIPEIIHEAFHIATTGRPGPVLIDIPKSVVAANNPDAYFDWYYPESVDLPGYQPVSEPDPGDVRAALELLRNSERPVLYVGGGVLKSRATAELMEFAERGEFPVVTTLMARGSFPDNHRLCYGMPGMHGNYTAVTAIQQCDLLVSVGARFDDRVTGKVDAFAARAKVIHIDIDPAEHGKIRKPDVSVLADCRVALRELIASSDADFADHSDWISQLDEWSDKYPVAYESESSNGFIKPQFVVEQLAALSPSDTIVTAGVGQHQMWASLHWPYNHPHTFINSGGFGTMGFAIPAAIGAKAGMADRMVWCIDGDGCFQMTSQELITAAVNKIPIKVALLNNGFLGMVRQWQELFYEERYSHVEFGFDVPDYCKMSEAMGCAAIQVTSPEEVGPAIIKANQINDRPVVVEFRCEPEEKVYPMVPAGASNDEIIVHPIQRSEVTCQRIPRTITQ